MNRETLLQLLHKLFEVPVTSQDDTDLRAYIQDSIDVGELAAVLRHDYRLTVELIDFKNVYTLADLIALVQHKS